MVGSFRNIHLIGIGGTGMAALATMLKDSGCRVTGSDMRVYPPMSDVLRGAGIRYAEGYRAENVPRDTDLVVIGNAVSRNNPEVGAVLERGVTYRSFPETLGIFFLEGRIPIVIAGTHGKTTTSALAAWTLDQGGLDPGFLIGGWVKNFQANSRYGKGKYFVVEGDEYDTAFFDKGPKFLHYHPSRVILTSVEFDHADIYSDIREIKRAFSSLVRAIPSDGFLIAAHGDPNIDAVVSDAACPVETYGLASGADWRAEPTAFTGGGTKFRVRHGSEFLGEFTSPLSGRHNMMNALAVIALSSHLGIPVGSVRAALFGFKGVNRRQEVLGVVNGVTVIDDFAHHPTAIRETLHGLRTQHPGARLWAVFEPRSATSRRRVFQKDLPAGFKEADRVIIAGLFSPDKIPADQRLDPERVVADLAAAGVQAAFIPDVADIVERLAVELREGDVVCIMSSGGFDSIHARLLDALRRR